MPCRMDDMPLHDARNRESTLKASCDKLTHENDMLREVVLSFMENPAYKPPAKIRKLVESAQVKHRQEDLDRLAKTFKASKDANRLGLVILADPKKPLAPQLGFDPDEF